jgi:pyridoxal phosphate enzyme (YggS family)
MMAAQTIAERFDYVNDQVNRICQHAHRNVNEVTLVVVTKTHPVEHIRDVVDAGALNLGENYVEEAREKISTFEPKRGLRWHMIGHIQSRKTGPVAEIFDYIHSLDREKIARRLDDARKGSEGQLPVLLECNVSGESTKYGWPAWNPSDWENLSVRMEPIFSYPHIRVEGLMTMAPYAEDPEVARPYFRRLRKLAEFLAKRFQQVSFEQLSMGMSGDYPVAIEEGATILRIGTAIMGERTI